MRIVGIDKADEIRLIPNIYILLKNKLLLYVMWGYGVTWQSGTPVVFEENILRN